MLTVAATNICAAEWTQPIPPATTPSNGQNYYLYNPAIALFLDMTENMASLNANGSSVQFATLADEWMLQGSRGLLYRQELHHELQGPLWHHALRIPRLTPLTRTL